MLKFSSTQIINVLFLVTANLSKVRDRVRRVYDLRAYEKDFVPRKRSLLARCCRMANATAKHQAHELLVSIVSIITHYTKKLLATTQTT